MKKVIYTIATIAVLMASCSKDCDALRQDIQMDYIEALQNSSGTPAAIESLRNQRDKKLAELDC